jgi:hypothetical protein
VHAEVCEIALHAAELIYAASVDTRKLKVLRDRHVASPEGAPAGGSEPAGQQGDQVQQGGVQPSASRQTQGSGQTQRSVQQQGAGQPTQKQQQQCEAQRQGRARRAQKRKASAVSSGEESSEEEQQVQTPRQRKSAPCTYRGEGSGGSPQLKGAAGSSQGGRSPPSSGRRRSVDNVPRQQHAPSPCALMTADVEGLLEEQVRTRVAVYFTRCVSRVCLCPAPHPRARFQNCVALITPPPILHMHCHIASGHCQCRTCSPCA